MEPGAQRRVGLKHLVYRLLFTGSLRPKPCSHLHLIQVTEPATNVCADCVALGDRWPALRMCLICGYVGCCNDAKNQHALKHYQATGHPLMRSTRTRSCLARSSAVGAGVQRSDDWLWCYEDKALLPLPAPGRPLV